MRRRISASGTYPCSWKSAIWRTSGIRMWRLVTALRWLCTQLGGRKARRPPCCPESGLSVVSTRWLDACSPMIVCVAHHCLHCIWSSSSTCIPDNIHNMITTYTTSTPPPSPLSLHHLRLWHHDGYISPFSSLCLISDLFFLCSRSLTVHLSPLFLSFTLLTSILTLPLWLSPSL